MPAGANTEFRAVAGYYRVSLARDEMSAPRLYEDEIARCDPGRRGELMGRSVTRRALPVLMLSVVVFTLGAACDQTSPPADVRYDSWEAIRDRLEQAGFAVEESNVGETSGPGRMIADEWGYVEVDGEELAIAVWDDERHAETILDEFTSDGPTALSLVSGPNWMMVWMEDGQEPALDPLQEAVGGVVHEAKE